MKRIVSLSLYGNDPVYLQGALRNARLQKTIYPGWTTRVYVSQEIPADLIVQLEASGAEVVLKQRQGEADGLFWRFLPAAEKDVDAVIVRDADSRLTFRERLAVDQWLESGKSLHIMRDHPCHGVVILAGMWGCRGGVLEDIGRQIDGWKLWQRKGYDQDFLCDNVYPRLRDDCLIHSELHCYRGEQIHPFPSARNRGEFIGCVYHADRDTLTDAQHDESLARFASAKACTLPKPKRRSRLYRHAHEWLRSLRRRAA